MSEYADCENKGFRENYSNIKAGYIESYYFSSPVFRSSEGGTCFSNGTGC